MQVTYVIPTYIYYQLASAFREKWSFALKIHEFYKRGSLMEYSELSIHCKAEAEVDPAFLINGGPYSKIFLSDLRKLFKIG